MKFKYRDIWFDNEEIKKKYGFEVEEGIATFQKPIPDAKFEALHLKIDEEGFTDPVKVRKEDNVLVDGHNRLYLCLKYGYKLIKVFVSIPTKEERLSWMRSAEGSRRGNESLYCRLRYALDKTLEEGLKKKGVRIKAWKNLIDNCKRAKRKPTEGDISKFLKKHNLQKSVLSSLEKTENKPFSTEKEQLKLAETKSVQPLSDVKFILNYKFLWNDLCKTFDEKLSNPNSAGSSTNMDYHGKKINVSIARLKKEVEVLVKIDEGLKGKTLCKEAADLIPDEHKVLFIDILEKTVAINVELEKIPFEAQIELAKWAVEEDNFDFNSLFFKLKELISDVKEDEEEEETESTEGAEEEEEAAEDTEDEEETKADKLLKGLKGVEEDLTTALKKAEKLFKDSSVIGNLLYLHKCEFERLVEEYKKEANLDYALKISKDDWYSFELEAMGVVGVIRLLYGKSRMDKEFKKLNGKN